ncbi:unnamed protein product [Strongylus vulgaris]|uniref:Uncharacterized protein n=1 Tax=Strongylus vulgaris TaxID=40348 RepID=A0A3P7J9I0_STRVU|nr:unnamed protein product [Strongylus vulgaris]
MIYHLSAVFDSSADDDAVDDCPANPLPKPPPTTADNRFSRSARGGAAKEEEYGGRGGNCDAAWIRITIVEVESRHSAIASANELTYKDRQQGKSERGGRDGTRDSTIFIAHLNSLLI